MNHITLVGCHPGGRIFVGVPQYEGQVSYPLPATHLHNIEAESDTYNLTIGDNNPVVFIRHRWHDDNEELHTFESPAGPGSIINCAVGG